MNRLIFVLTIFLLGINQSTSQEDKIGAMKTPKGTLIYDNSKDPYTIDLIGEVKLDNYPFIDVNNKNFQFLINNSEDKKLPIKELLKLYMDWEVNFINELLPTKVEPKSEFLISDNEALNFWYYKNPILTDAPKDITPYKMTFFLDWKKGNYLYKIVFPSFDDDIEKGKDFLIEMRKKIRYYTKPIDLEKLYENIQKGNNYYYE